MLFSEIIITFMFLLDKSRKKIQSRQVPHSLPLRAPNSVDNYATPLKESLWCEDQPRKKEDKERQGGNPAWDSFFLLFSQFNQRNNTATGGWYKEKTSKVEVRLTTWHPLFTFCVCVFETWVWRFHRACLHNRAGILSRKRLRYSWRPSAQQAVFQDRSGSFFRGVAIAARLEGRTLDFYYSSERPCFLAATADRRQTRWRRALTNEAFHLETALCHYYAYKVRLQPRTQACKADGGKHCLSAPITSPRTSRVAARPANNTAEVILFFKG